MYVERKTEEKCVREFVYLPTRLDFNVFLKAKIWSKLFLYEKYIW